MISKGSADDQQILGPLAAKESHQIITLHLQEHILKVFALIVAYVKAHGVKTQHGVWNRVNPRKHP